ncbi:S8 family peptidase [Paenibacillus sp. sptzw28]|nr:S8 family peptidase [Paenibacillus sp. sptzw28]
MERRCYHLAKLRLIPYIVESISATGSEIPAGVRAVHAPEVWAESKGTNVVVAVIDTGCDYNHPDLRGRVIGGRNFSKDYNANPNEYMDNNGHGTHVAGTIGAIFNNSGVVGVAPEVKLLVLKVLGSDGSGSYQSIVDAVRYAAQWRGPNGQRVRVISMSLGGPDDVPAVHEAIKNAVASNILVVCAAGNEGDGNPNTVEKSFPGAYQEVVEVGAVDVNGTPASFTNTNSEIDLVGPGINILSTYPGNRYATLSGTSMAAPHISGGAAVLIDKLEREYGRALSEAEIYAQLVKHTRSLRLDKRIEGNGMLDLTAVSQLPPSAVPKTIAVRKYAAGYAVVAGYFKNKAEADVFAEQVRRL